MRWRDLALAALSALVAGCSAGGSGGGDSGGTRELALRQVAQGSIETVGKVDWYHFRAVEANGVLQVRCNSNTVRPDVELLVAVYEADAQGRKTRIYGDHAPEGSQLPADLALNVYVGQPKDLYITVRDLMDDEASPNPYYLSVDFVGAADPDGSFANAVAIPVAGAQAPVPGVVERMADVDCYTFQVEQAGVYEIDVEFHPFGGGTDVTLAVRLYDEEGVPVAAHPGGYRTEYRLIPYLAAGTYYLVVEDAGRDDFDPSSPYDVAVRPRPAVEARANDSMDSASALASDPLSGAFGAEGALDYLGDRDWYRVPAASAATAGIRVLDLAFDDTGGDSELRFHLSVVDEAGKEILSHEYTAGSAEYRTQLRAGQGDQYVVVEPAKDSLLVAPAPYRLRVRVQDVDDPAEAAPGNDTIDTAQPLSPESTAETGWTAGRIAFRGDEDWFRVDTDTSVDRVVEVFLETEGPAPPEYALSILRDGLIRKVYDSVGEDGPVRLKASVFVPAADPSRPVTYFFRVCDFQGDEGGGSVPYRIRCNVTPVPAALLPDPFVGIAAVYHDESVEHSPIQVRLEHNSLLKSQFAADTSTLLFRGETLPPGVTKDQANGTTRVTFPWVGGYMDYQGDQDWFELDLGPLTEAGQIEDASWYYDIEIQLYSPGSPVEYVWKLYRDVNRNRILVDRPRDSNGFFASAGDPDTAAAELQVTTPEPGSNQKFWVGDAWEGKFYLSVSDFHFVGAAEPDEDWGYQAPYYFKLTLVYHPGVSHP